MRRAACFDKLVQAWESRVTNERKQITRSPGSNRSDDDIDAFFSKLRSDVRFLVWVMAANLVMSIMILIGVLFMDVQI